MRAFTVTMQPIVIFALSLYAICSADPDLSYTIFGGSFDSCQFRPADVTSGEGLCSNDIVIDASDVFQGSDLTWEILVQACPNLLIGGCADPDWVEGDEHDMTTDLVWPRFSACDECPRCPCTTDGNITYNTYSYTTFNTDSAFSVSQCYECECNSWYFFGGNQVLALECSTGSANTPTFDSPAELASAECPYDNANPVTTEAISGCDDGNGNTIPIGTYFPEAIENCGVTYCYCNSSLAIECLQQPDDCPDTILNCTTDYETQTFSSDNNFAASYYCGWGKVEVPDSFTSPGGILCINADSLHSPLNEPAWHSIQSKARCDAFYGYENLASSDGLCSITTVEFTAQIYDCVDLEWKSGTQETKVYDLCCGSSEDGEPACNNQNISASALGSDNLCESNSNVETYYSTYYECIYGSRGVSEEYIKEIECGTSFETGSNTKNRVCDILSDKWLWETSCECELRQAMVGMYGNSDYENDLKLNLQAEFNAGYADLKATLEGWKEYYGCGAGMKFECDIYDGTTVDTPSPIENTGGDTPSPSAPTSPTAPTMPTMPTTDESSAFCLNNFYVFCVISLFLSFCL